MSTPDTDHWHRTSPLAAIFYLGKIYQAIAQHALPSLAPLGVFLFAAEGSMVNKIVLGLSGFILVTVTGAFLRYWFFRYRITDDSILVREGVLTKTQLDIKFDRIQAVSTQQNVIFRAFGLVTVKLDTAGSAKQEGHLPAVTIAMADGLKERIRREPYRGTLTNDDGEDAVVENNGAGAEKTLLSLDARDMVKIGLSSNRALLFLVFLGPLMQQIDDDIEENIVEGNIPGGAEAVAAVEAAQTSLAAGIGVGLIIVLGVLLFLVVASIIGAFLQYHRFRLVAGNDMLRSQAGLLTRHEHSINLAKIQTVVAKQNFMLRLFRRFRLNAKQASSGKPGKGKSFTIPLCNSEQLPELADELFGEEFADILLEPYSNEFLPIAKHYVKSRVILFGVFPATAFTALMLVPLGISALFFLLWIPLIACVVWRRYKCFGVRVTNDGIVRRRGFIGYEVTAFLHRKVQRVSLTQTPSQRRKGLASLRFYLASGSIKVPYVNFEKASQLRDYVLYKVEDSQVAWH